MSDESKYPKVGEIWERKTGNPFSPESTIRILEIKDGWARYCFICDDGEDGMTSELELDRLAKFYTKREE